MRNSSLKTWLSLKVVQDQQFAQRSWENHSIAVKLIDYSTSSSSVFQSLFLSPLLLFCSPISGKKTLQDISLIPRSMGQP